VRTVLCRALCALFFVAWTAEKPLDIDKIVYCGLWRSPMQVFGPLFVSLPGLQLNTWQVLLILLTLACVFLPGGLRRQGWQMDEAIGIGFASVALTFLWGVARGGSAYNAYYQLWRFLAGLLFGFLLLCAMRKSAHLKMLGTTVVAAAVLRAGLAMWFYWFHVRGLMDPPPPYMTTHDNSLLFVAGMIIAVSWALARGRWKTWMAAVLICAHLFYAIALNRRRLAWIELMLALVPGYLLLPSGRLRRRVTAFVLVLAPVIALYVIVGRDRQGAIFEPVRAFSTSGSYQDTSSLARMEEIRNLLYTLWAAGNPVLGTGWGVPYQKLTSLYANFGKEWWQYVYLPHNSLLAVAVFGGFVAIFGMWQVVSVAAMLASRGYRGSTRPVDRAAAMAAVCILPAYGVQCYGDIGLQALPCALMLGAAVGVAGTVAALADAPVERFESGWRADTSGYAIPPRSDRGLDDDTAATRRS